jgi:uncharacterized membrane protein
MSIPREELLKPSLSLTHTTRAPYSITTTVMTAFFGGPLSIIGLTALNAWRLGRLMRDAIPLVIALAAYFVFLWVLAQPEWGGVFLEAMKKHTGIEIPIIFRFFALILCGLGYSLHRKEQRNADLAGMVRPNGWIAGIAFIVGNFFFYHFIIDRFFRFFS